MSNTSDTPKTVPLPSESSPFSEMQLHRLFLAIIAGLPFILFISLLDNGPFNIDDRHYLELNPLVNRPSLDSFFDLFNPFGAYSIETSEYLPIFTLSLALASFIPGDPFFGQHLLNVILYAGLCSLLFLVVKRHVPLLIAFCSIVLFTVHPLHIEAIAWVVARADLLMYFFSVSALVVLHASIGQPTLRFILALGLWALATFSKQTPGLFLLLAAYLFVFKKNDLRTWVLTAAPFGAISAIGTLLTFSAGTLNRMEPTSILLWERPLYSGLLVQRYLVQSIAPLNLSFYYTPFPSLSSIWVELLCSGILIGTLIAGFLLSSSARRHVFLVPLFLFPLLPTLQLIPFNIMQSNRYAFLSILAVTLAVTQILHHLASKRAFLIGCGIYSLLLTALSIGEVVLWERNVLVWQNAVKETNAPFAHYHLGRAYLEENDDQRALASFLTVLNVAPTHQKSYERAAEIYSRTGRLQKAEELLRIGLKETSSDLLKMHLANILAQTGQVKEATRLLCEDAIRDSTLQDDYISLRKHLHIVCDKPIKATLKQHKR